VVFASGSSVAIKDIAEKLEVNEKDVKQALNELLKKYDENCGINLLLFNGKAQFSTNPQNKNFVSQVLSPIKEKEFTNTILECSAIIAYKQPITKGELEIIRGLNSDYAIHTLLELEMIEPIGRKDAIGRPILYATTDNFLKRFKLNSLDDLPDYDTLMEQISKLNGERVGEDNYLYSKSEITEIENKEKAEAEQNAESVNENKKLKSKIDDYEIPEFLQDVDLTDIIKIK